MRSPAGSGGSLRSSVRSRRGLLYFWQSLGFRGGSGLEPAPVRARAGRFVREVAGDGPGLAEGREAGRRLRAERSGAGAPGSERAAAVSGPRARDLSLQGLAGMAQARVGDGGGAQKGDRVRMGGRGEEGLGGRLLHAAAEIHDHHPVAEVAHDLEVVGDEEEAQAVAPPASGSGDWRSAPGSRRRAPRRPRRTPPPPARPPGPARWRCAGAGRPKKRAGAARRRKRAGPPRRGARPPGRAGRRGRSSVRWRRGSSITSRTVSLGFSEA